MTSPIRRLANARFCGVRALWAALPLLGFVAAGATSACSDSISGGNESSVDFPTSAHGGLQQLKNHLTPAITEAPFVGFMDPSERLTLVLGLEIKDAAALADAVKRVSDPESPEYRHYVTTAEFADRFGASVADYEKVIAWGRARNLEVTPHGNRLTVQLSGAVGDIEAALHVRMGYHSAPTERSFARPMSSRRSTSTCRSRTSAISRALWPRNPQTHRLHLPPTWRDSPTWMVARRRRARAPICELRTPVARQ